MSKDLTENFVNALHGLERDGDAEVMVSLFTEDCEIGNTALHDTLNGRDGVRKFWTNYRATFAELESNFKNQIVSDGSSALEWESVGRSANGEEVRYQGVSILEDDGERITRFFAYFDPADLGKQITGDINGKDTEERR